MTLKAGMLAVAIILLGPGISFANGAACQPQVASFHGTGDAINVAVEIADSPPERSQGLMFRKDLPRGQGMLFIYEHPQPVSFWMRNTLIPLDMVFIDARGVVRHVHPMARPLDETAVPGAAPGDPSPERLMVLEVAGGEAARLGIQPGMVLSHPALPQGTALRPCH